ncbi:calcium binding protein [Streptomyces clavuligerus]|nr:calcium binding protein [Streptomyces clavuligerus]
MTGLQRAKLALRFRQMDKDGNGWLQAADYEAMARRLITASGTPAGSPAAVRMTELALGMWRALEKRMDTDGDGRISPEEFIASTARSVIGHDGYDRVIRPMMTHIITLFDTDGDRRLSQDEFCALFTCCGLTPADAGIAFGKLDADGDGHLTCDEINTAVRAFFVSTDADTPANWLFGPLHHPSTGG